jgi:hypothetical protein
LVVPLRLDAYDSRNELTNFADRRCLENAVQGGLNLRPEHLLPSAAWLVQPKSRPVPIQKLNPGLL